MHHTPKTQVVIAKHKLVEQQDGQREVHLCDVTSWTDSEDVQHGIGGKLEVTTHRFTTSKSINTLPKFRLTLIRKPTPQLVSFLDRLRKSRQVMYVGCNGGLGCFVVQPFSSL